MKRHILIALALLAFPPTALNQTQDDKTALYKKYEESKKGGAEQQRAAYEAAKQYLEKFGTSEDQNTQTMRRFVAAYERLLQLDSLLKTREYVKVVELGRQILANEPDNFYVITKIVEAGFNSAQAGNAALSTEAIGSARKALQLLDSGKVKDPSPLANVDAARAFHNIALATLLLDIAPDEAAPIFLKVLQTAEYKKEPSLYYYFGLSLLKGDYQRLVSEFKQKYEGKPETPESKAMFERINHVVARIIDAYARSVALCTTPEQDSTRNQVLPQLTAIYKAAHNNSDAGLSELIADVLSKPMP